MKLSLNPSCQFTASCSPERCWERRWFSYLTYRSRRQLARLVRISSYYLLASFLSARLTHTIIVSFDSFINCTCSILYCWFPVNFSTSWALELNSLPWFSSTHILTSSSRVVSYNRAYYSRSCCSEGLNSRAFASVICNLILIFRFHPYACKLIIKTYAYFYFGREFPYWYTPPAVCS